MLDNTRAQFRTATQYKRWIAFRDYFKDIINRQDSGEEVWVIDESGSIERLGEILFVHSSSHDNDDVGLFLSII